MGAPGEAGEAGLVSVLLSTRNRAASLGVAMQSVLDQEGVDLELIVVNDGSTDATAAVLAAHGDDSRVRVFHQEESRGLPASLNRAAKEARGALLARVDDDDRWIRRDKLLLQRAAFEASPDLVLLGTGYRDEAQRAIRNPLRDADIRKQMLFRCPFCHPSVVMRASAFHAVGGYDEAMTYGEDWELWLRLGTTGRLGNLGELCVEKAGGQKTLSAQNFDRQLHLAVSLAGTHRDSYPGASRALGMHRFSRWFFDRFPLGGAVHRALSRAYRGVFSLERD
ncbi:MAG: glycosyltransferase [Xanthomonadales bacterium]|jgi:glycosyltransferase involved in cell wall biosynthesis|nr:glycosyltransferase [Xanthomonadales bacterium]